MDLERVHQITDTQCRQIHNTLHHNSHLMHLITLDSIYCSIKETPEKRTAAIAEHSHKEKEFSTDSNKPAVPSMEGEMLSELMVSLDQRLSNSTHQ